MSCCASAPPIKVASIVSQPNAGPESDIQPGETVECYAERSGNQTGKLDDATENPAGKIENTIIPINTSNGTVDVTFRLTTGSPVPAASWELTRTNAGSWPVSGVTFTSNGPTARLEGMFPVGFRGEAFEVLLIAKNASGEQIDARTFKFSPAVASSTNSVSLVHPMPGAIVNSKFGPRLHPISKQMKLHAGVDMKMPDRSTRDVLAAADGEVTFAGVSGTLTSGYGNCVKIKHTNGSGAMLCTTLYGHLARLYVAVGQKVAAGQKIGHEGTTGSSTGNHLHFELRLPNNAPVDPIPYIRGSITQFDETTPNGEPSGQPKHLVGRSSITEADNAAKTTPCTAPGVNPQTKAAAPPPTDAPPPAPGDAFEKAWFFTMTYEVGPHWGKAPQWSPGDAELDAGLKETDVQKKKVGWKNWPQNLGGLTKFGVAQYPNRNLVNVEPLTYSQAKSFGRSNYWRVPGLANCENKPELVGIILFDLNYLHGIGGGRSIYEKSGLGSLSQSMSHAEQLAAAQKLNDASIAHVKTLRRDLQEGWLNRCYARGAYVKSLPFPIV